MPRIVGVVVGGIIAAIMLVPIGYDKEVVKVQVEPVIETAEVLEITTIGTMIIMGTLTGEAHLTPATALMGIGLTLVSAFCAWAASALWSLRGSHSR